MGGCRGATAGCATASGAFACGATAGCATASGAFACGATAGCATASGAFCWGATAGCATASGVSAWGATAGCATAWGAFATAGCAIALCALGTALGATALPDLASTLLDGTASDVTASGILDTGCCFDFGVGVLLVARCVGGSVVKGAGAFGFSHARARSFALASNFSKADLDVPPLAMASQEKIQKYRAPAMFK